MASFSALSASTGWNFSGRTAGRSNSRLTLEYGARYAYLGPTFTLGDLLQNYFFVDKYDPARAVRIETANGPTNGSIIPGSGDPFNGMVEEGNGIPTGGVQHRKNQISPRFGSRGMCSATAKRRCAEASATSLSASARTTPTSMAWAIRR